MLTSCTICSSKDRVEIERALLSMSSGSTQRGLDDIAAQFDCSVEDLKLHALFHTPAFALPAEPDAEEQTTKKSLVRAMKLTEADMLAEVNAEYLITLKALGRRINSIIDASGDDMDDESKKFTASKMLTKPMVELYLGMGSEIRQTVKAAAEIDRMLNGPQDSTTTGLTALAEAIRGSAKE